MLKWIYILANTEKLTKHSTVLLLHLVSFSAEQKLQAKSTTQISLGHFQLLNNNKPSLKAQIKTARAKLAIKNNVISQKGK